jgi:hypothetical protein
MYGMFIAYKGGGGGVGTLCKISVYLAAGMAVEAVPVMTLKGQHVLCGQAVGILLHPRFVAWSRGINFLLNVIIS